MTRVPDAVQRLLTVHRRAGTVPNTGAWYDPGSAAHRHSASKTRVNALMAESYALRCVRGTQKKPGALPPGFSILTYQWRCQ
jgi:hypothetical protein